MTYGFYVFTVFFVFLIVKKLLTSLETPIKISGSMKEAMTSIALILIKF